MVRTGRFLDANISGFFRRKEVSWSLEGFGAVQTMLAAANRHCRTDPAVDAVNLVVSSAAENCCR